MTRLIALAGSSPGIGKSTACRALCRRLREAGLRVDHFEEDHIRSRPEFAGVAADFDQTGAVSPQVLLEATASYVTAARDVIVTDALMPYIPSLLAFGQTQTAIASFLDRLDDVLAPLDPVLVYLDGDPDRALARASEREGPQWLDWFVAKLARYRVSPPVHDPPTAARYLRYERELTLRLLGTSRWRLAIIPDADRGSPEEVEAAVLAHLSREFAGGSPHSGRSNHATSQ